MNINLKGDNSQIKIVSPKNKNSIMELMEFLLKKLNTLFKK